MFVGCACGIRHHLGKAAIAQLGERQTADLKVPGSTQGLGTEFIIVLGLWLGDGWGVCTWFASVGFDVFVAMPVWPR